MTRINYITNLDINNYSGGWSGMNHHVYEQLTHQFEVNLVQKVDPPYLFREKIISKAFRVAGLKGLFPAFTRRRLNLIKQKVESCLGNNGQLNFYHGSTPWLQVENKVPYAAYLDCCFASYIRVYHNQQHFNTKQLYWLFKNESAFLAGACCIFFSSKWALEDAKTAYQLKGDNFCVAGLGGGLEFENNGNIHTKKYFLFISMDFRGKGGDLLVDAFEELKREYPEFSLKIAGQAPPEKYKSLVEYEGLLNKSDKTQLNKLKQLFTEAYCFVLPTSKDMTPLVLVEASAAGCPVISTDSFGIPEIIRNHQTGILLNPASSLKEGLVKAMKQIIVDKDMRAKFVRTSPAHIRNNFTWQRTGKIIREKLLESFPAWKEQQ